MALHNSIVAEDMHTLLRWTHADAAERQAQGVTSQDVGKLSRQLDDGSFWLLSGVGPVVWKNISGLGQTFSRMINLWPQTTNLNEWYGPNYWQSLDDGGFFMDQSYGVGADPVLGNFQLTGMSVPYDCILERIAMVGYANNNTVDMEVRWYKYPFTSGNASLGAGTQIATTQIGPNAANSMTDWSQDPATVLDKNDFVIPFFRDVASAAALNAQLVGSLSFRQIIA